MKKVILAYSGGLDTSVILKWLAVEKGYEVIAACIDVGQKEDFEEVSEKAIAVGANKIYIVDAKESFIKDYVMKGVKAGAVYEDDYLLGSAYARPLIAQKLVELAKLEGAVAIAHGATGKGNDQVRFEAGIKALAPELKIEAPWREWAFKSREDCISYAKEHNIPIPVTKKEIYSRDENLWHISHEGGELENTWQTHSESVYKWVKPLNETVESPEIMKLQFEKGIPVAINDVLLPIVEIVQQLNEIGAQHKIGVLDVVENRLVGMKSRGIYETPGGTIIQMAHNALEKLVFDRQTMRVKKQLSTIYADLVYDGLWFSPLKSYIDSFVDSTQETVCGNIQLSLFKGQVSVIASKSENSLYSEEHVTFGEDEVYNQKDAEGFINLFTLPLKLSCLVNKKTTVDLSKSSYLLVAQDNQNDTVGVI